MAFTRYKTIVTRKPHKCSSCGCNIGIGEPAKYGVTTDSEHTATILSCYWCCSCATLN